MTLPSQALKVAAIVNRCILHRHLKPEVAIADAVGKLGTTLGPLLIKRLGLHRQSGLMRVAVGSARGHRHGLRNETVRTQSAQDVRPEH